MVSLKEVSLDFCLFVMSMNDHPNIVRCITHIIHDNNKIFSLLKFKMILINFKLEWIILWTGLISGKSSLTYLNVRFSILGKKSKIQIQWKKLFQRGRITYVNKTSKRCMSESEPRTKIFQSYWNREKILGLIRRLYQYMDGEKLKNLLIALVSPYLEFGNVVWT